MNDDSKIEKMDVDSKQLDRAAKRKACDTIRKWTDHVLSVGGGDSTGDWHSSSSGIYGDSSEEDDSIISETTSEGTSEDGTDDLEGDAGREQEVLLEVWGDFLRNGKPDAARSAKRSRLDSGSDQGGEELSADLGASSDNDDCTSEGSDGSSGSLANFIC